MNDELAEVALGKVESDALRIHLRGCAACVAALERQRALAERMDVTVSTLVRSEPPSRLVESITARARSPQRWQPWIGTWRRVAFGAVLVAAVIGLMIGLRGLQPPMARSADVAALTAWRSPTGALLEWHGSVLDAPLDRIRVTIEPKSSRK